jgi:hypothetical protein
VLVVCRGESRGQQDGWSHDGSWTSENNSTKAESAEVTPKTDG